MTFTGDMVLGQESFFRGCNPGRMYFLEAFRFLQISWRKGSVLPRSVAQRTKPQGEPDMKVWGSLAGHSCSLEGGCEGQCVSQCD